MCYYRINRIWRMAYQTLNYRPSMVSIRSFFLGGVFVIGFNLVAFTIKEYGIMIATIFQKMSLIVPALMGILIYLETNSLIKSLGIVLSVLAIILISFPSSRKSIPLKMIWLPIGTWIMSGIIEGTLLYVDSEGIADNADIGFVSSIFFCAGSFGLVGLIFLSLRRKLIINKRDIAGGIILGVPNFFSIWLILVLLVDGWEGSVLFPINNVGILVFSTLIGLIAFSEEIDKIKIIGFLAAFASIIMVGTG